MAVVYKGGGHWPSDSGLWALGLLVSSGKDFRLSQLQSQSHFPLGLVNLAGSWEGSLGPGRFLSVQGRVGGWDRAKHVISARLAPASSLR